MKRSGPDHTGPGRVFAVRVLLLLTMSFFVAGACLAGLLSLGYNPLA